VLTDVHNGLRPVREPLAASRSGASQRPISPPRQAPRRPSGCDEPSMDEAEGARGPVKPVVGFMAPETPSGAHRAAMAAWESITWCSTPSPGRRAGEAQSVRHGTSRSRSRNSLDLVGEMRRRASRPWAARSACRIQTKESVGRSGWAGSLPGGFLPLSPRVGVQCGASRR
jgi:hypothetical protein